MTKKKNPIPGHFDYQTTHDPRVNDFTYTVPLGGAGNYYIAAHAVVNDQESVQTGNLNIPSGPGIDAYGPSSVYKAFNADWGKPIPAVGTWVHSSWPSITGATWISTSYYIGQLGGTISGSSWRMFHKEFELPASAFNISGSADVTADNAEEVYLNGSLAGSDGELQDPYQDDYEWNTILNYDLTSWLTPGVNEFDFIVRNYPGTNSPTGNPTGLIYDVNIEYQYDGNAETAWGDGCEGTSFPGKNWGTYFMYVVTGCE
jgi:hypothetical protein